ncbi:MAG: hypothetical protein F6K22_24960 [Okeania sp. SIO2F4]|uniref:hypothetical protein n=1 Tax=Okeania sp. SIO2F4 TaxID=2607790 RepID=UPI00142B8C59|nr:hypothetical protein [Okeania sp. SIO2F4]NES05773.1 hypothetical protein [Okeania sp. SIO2F4]
MENRETSSTVINNPQSQLKWLEIAEYSALGASVLGSGLAWFFEQILWAATPITLGLFLNTINRKIFEEKIQKQTNNEVEELRIDMNSVFQQLDSLPKTITEQTLESSQNQSNFEYNTITKEDWEAINIKFSDIEEELQLLKKLATDLQQNQEDNLQSTNNTSMPNEIEQLQTQITRLQELNRDIVRPYFIRLIRAVKQLEKTIKY